MDDTAQMAAGVSFVLDRSTYLISNSLGAMPREVYDRSTAMPDSWAERGVRAWEEGWWDMAVGVGDQMLR